MITIESLQIILDKHRKKDLLTCPENCWCWELEIIIMKEESVKVKILIAEFGGKTYRIPEKRWPLVEKNLSYYSEHEK